MFHFFLLNNAVHRLNNNTFAITYLDSTMNLSKNKTHLILILLVSLGFIACKQENPTHNFKNGNAKYNLKDYNGAVQDLNKAIELNKNFTEAYYVRAICYGELKKTEKAESDFNKVLILDANFKDAYVNRAFYVKEANEDYKGALADYNLFIKMNIDGDNAFALNNRGFVKYKMDNFEEALADINNSLQFDPTNSYAYKNRALIYIALDSIDVACANLSKAIELGYTTNFDDSAQRLFYEYCEK